MVFFVTTKVSKIVISLLYNAYFFGLLQ